MFRIDGHFFWIIDSYINKKYEKFQLTILLLWLLCSYRKFQTNYSKNIPFKFTIKYFATKNILPFIYMFISFYSIAGQTVYALYYMPNVLHMHFKYQAHN